MKPAIVIPCYNRKDSLERLIRSLCAADFGAADGGVHLVFSVDHGGGEGVREVIENCVWPYGEKQVYYHRKNIGLRDNILFCGELSVEYGAVIVLEDDLIVSPIFYRYACAALDFYSDEDSVGQIALYGYEISEVSMCRFEPIADGSDVYFMRWACSWGQIWTAAQWRLFRKWYHEHREYGVSKWKVPSYVAGWPETSWKKWYIAYLEASQRYVVYPRTGVVTNSGDSGENVSRSLFPVFTASIEIFREKGWRFTYVQESLSVYDSHFELTDKVAKRICPELSNYDFTCDFHGVKPLNTIKCEYLLSIKPCRNPLWRADGNMMPIELGLLKRGPQGTYSFGLTSDFSEKIPFLSRMRHAMWTQRLVGPLRGLVYAVFRVLKIS